MVYLLPAAEEAGVALSAILGQDLGLNSRLTRGKGPIVQEEKLRLGDTKGS